MSKIKLSKPVTWDGKEQTELDLGLDKLSGDALCSAEDEFLATRRGFTGVMSLQLSYLAIVAAKALKRPVEDVRALPAKDFVKVVDAVSDFLN